MDAAVLRGDDARRHGVLEAVGVPDGDDPFPHLDGVGIPEFEDRKVLVGIDFNDRKVEGGVLAQDLRRIGLAVGEGDRDLVHAVDDVVVRQNPSLLGDDEAGPASLHGDGTREVLERIAEELPKEGIVVEGERDRGTPGLGLHVDVHDGGRGLLYDGDDGRHDRRAGRGLGRPHLDRPQGQKNGQGDPRITFVSRTGMQHDKNTSRLYYSCYCYSRFHR